MKTPIETELKVDQKSLHVVYRHWPEHFKQAGNIKCSVDRDPSCYSLVLFCGMGGSATAGDIMNDVMQHNGNIPCLMVRGQILPPVIDKRSLVVVNSVSGNTSEALRMAKEASDRKAEVICISSGGSLKEFALSNGHKHISIPNLSLPRASLPYLVMPCLKVISPFINGFEYEETSSEICSALTQESKNVSMEVPDDLNRAKQIASFLKVGFTFCFTSPFLLSVGTRFKNSLNENAKLHCFKDSILESTHNEIVPFTYVGNGSQRRVILAGWNHDSHFVRERFSRVKLLFSEIGQQWNEISSMDTRLIVAILRSIYLLDYVTIYMAINKGLDPSPTPAIDILKST